MELRDEIEDRIGRPDRDAHTLAPLGLPAAAAAAARGAAAPRAGSAVRRQPARTLGALIAAADRDIDVSAIVDRALNVDSRFAAIADGAVLDADAVAVGHVASAGF